MYFLFETIYVCIIETLIPRIQIVNNTLHEYFTGTSLGEIAPTYYGICATISVAFVTLLFAIAAINYSMQRTDTSAYGLKLLIKRDLIRVAVWTILPSLILMCGSAIVGAFIPNIIHAILMIIICVLVISVLWFTTNSVYYMILQNNVCRDFSNRKISKTTGKYEFTGFKIQPYDVYTIQKTLYPKANRKAKKIFKKNLKSSSKNTNVPLKKLRVEGWNSAFLTVLSGKVEVVNKYAKRKNITFVDALSDEELKDELKCFLPKIQAPDKVVLICLNLSSQINNANTIFPTEDWDVKSIDCKHFERILLLLSTAISYAEDRQDEWKWKHNRINRGNYNNPNDTFIYTFYGDVLYNYARKKSENPDECNRYVTLAKCSYESAIAVDSNNSVARERCEKIKNCNPELTPQNDKCSESADFPKERENKKRLERIVSGITHPFLLIILSLIGIGVFLWHLQCDALDLLFVSLCLSLSLLAIVPGITRFVCKKRGSKSNTDNTEQSSRIIPYIVSMISMGVCTGLLLYLTAPLMFTHLAGSLFLATVLLGIFNCKMKVSVHMGMAGIFCSMCISLFEIPGLFSLIILPLVIWARLSLKKHTIFQLLLGGIVGLVSPVIVYIIFRTMGFW